MKKILITLALGATVAAMAPAVASASSASSPTPDIQADCPKPTGEAPRYPYAPWPAEPTAEQLAQYNSALAKYTSDYKAWEACQEAWRLERIKWLADQEAARQAAALAAYTPAPAAAPPPAPAASKPKPKPKPKPKRRPLTKAERHRRAVEDAKYSEEEDAVDAVDNRLLWDYGSSIVRGTIVECDIVKRHKRYQCSIYGFGDWSDVGGYANITESSSGHLSVRYRIHF
jgi:hypothetical protein